MQEGSSSGTKPTCYLIGSMTKTMTTQGNALNQCASVKAGRYTVEIKDGRMIAKGPDMQIGLIISKNTLCFELVSRILELEK